MNKKLTALLAVLLIIAVLFGCTRAAENAEVTTAAMTSQAQQLSGHDLTTTAKSTTKTAQKTTSATTEKGSTTTEKSTSKTTEKNTAKRKSSTAKKAKNTDKTTTKKPRVTTTEKRVDKTRCTITISCKAILSHMDDLRDGKQDYVPSNGYILRTCTVKYEDGDTVYDILKRVCREEGITLRAKRTGFGMYVEGINNLNEKDCGGTSGWTYYVDGKFPPVAVDKYELHGGEVIEFKYVV